MKRTLLLVTFAGLLVAGCSTDEPTAAPAAAATPSTTTAATSTTPALVATSDIYGTNPAGLTTAVNAPVTMSADELSRACIEIQAFANSLGMTDTETVLALTQMTAADSTEGFTVTEGEGTNWADSSPSEQAGLIAAINAAMDGEC